MRRPTALLLVAALSVAPALARANGDPAATGPPTVYERFVLSACAPCVRAAYAVATLAITPPGLPALPPGVRAVGRAGEITIDVLRAHQPGRPDWKSLALRVTLSVAAGSGGESYRLGTGLLDGVDVPALVQTVDELARLAAAPPAGDARAESVDVDFHGGSLRVGLLRIRGDAVAYVQTGDLSTLMQRALWDVPTTLYLSPKDVPALAAALARAAATIEQIRGN
jgi:hypothetical protein